MNLQPGPDLDRRRKSCLQCHKDIIRGKKESNRDWFGRRFCSNTCATRHRNLTKGIDPNNWVILECSYCNSKFSARRNYFERGQYKYCSPECRKLASRKHECVEFNGKLYHFNPIHGYLTSTDGKKMHRDVWEFYNGPIPKGYVIHHIDENKTNNSIDNLQLMEWGEHTRHHHLGRIMKRGKRTS